MDALKQKILSDGKVIGSDILKVDSFLNHQVDVQLLSDIGAEFARLFGDSRPTRILTCEASGIIPAFATAQAMGLPLVFAKKAGTKVLGSDTYRSNVFSFTKQNSTPIQVSRQYISARDRVLIIDDFLANGQAVLGLSDIVKQAGALLVGVGIVVEKGFQNGGRLVREAGIRLESLAVIGSMAQGSIVFQ